MSTNNQNRRAWIKNIAIIFLSVLLVLTLFSNTILNHSLPEVSAQYVSYDTISSAIKLTGTVKANESHSVIYEDDASADGDTIGQTRKIVSVYVKEGDMVEIGTPILALKGGPSTELEAAEKELREKEDAYNLALLNDKVTSIGSGESVTAAEQRLSDLREELADLNETYQMLKTAAGVGSAGTDNLDEQVKAYAKRKAELSEKKSELDAKISEFKGKYEGIMAELGDDFSDASIDYRLTVANEEYTAIEQTYNSLKAEVEAAEKLAEDLKDSTADVSEIVAICESILSLEEQINGKNKTIERARENYIDELKLAAAVISGSAEDETVATGFPDAADSAKGYGSEPGSAKVEGFEFLATADFAEIEDIIRRNPYSEWDDTEDDLRTTLAGMLADGNDGKIEEYIDSIRDSAKNYRRSMEDYGEELYDLREQQSEEYGKLAVLGVNLYTIDAVTEFALNRGSQAADKELSVLQKELEEITTEYETAKKKAENLAKAVEYEKKTAEFKAEAETLQTELESVSEILAPLEGEGNADFDAFLKKITDKEREIASAEIELQKAQASGELSSATTQQEREAQLREIGELKKKIEAYKNAPETTDVTAPIAGRIVEINRVPGNTVTSGDTVARIEVAEKGYVCEISVPSEEARKIRVGAECSVTNSWWSNLEASVTQVRSDPQSQGKNRIVVIEVKGEVNEGQSLNFTIGDRSQSYNSVLPNSAIREDSEGKFVLVVESKNTPLGVRYTAVRYQIEIMASDDTKSAVTGLMGSEFVITNASLPITDGQQVRLADK
ncbi:MAG: HlyD family efflux transporter periplasmic adaptor subunit [Ruminococcaceae bacterium]|nr:HlyD family efflux transporter periplasmic adaptor subunit [Oscillospiraceae bacterium]